MKYLLRLLWASFLTLALTGCYEETQRIVLNPDGSGKAHVEILRAASVPTGLSEEDQEFDPRVVLKETAAAIVEKSEGIDAWRDIEFGYREDGRMFFRGTAYFPQFSGFRIDSLAGPNSSSSGEFNPKLELRRTEEGLLLAARPPDPKKEEPAGELDPFKERIKYQSMRGMMAATFSGLRNERTIVLPGEPVEVSGFAVEGRTVRFVFEGDRMLEAIDRIFTDKEVWKRMVAAGAGAEDLQKWAEKMILGGELRARVPGPLSEGFDYPGEVDKARDLWEKEKRKLAVTAKEKETAGVAPTAERGKEIDLDGIHLVAMEATFMDRQSHPGLPLFGDREWKTTLAMRLPQKVTAVEKGFVTAAVAMDGTDLLPEKEWDRTIHFPKLAESGEHVVAELSGLKLPDDLSAGIRELAGELICLISHGEKTVDLGAMLVSNGTEATQLGAVIDGVGPDEYTEGKYTFDLKFKSPRYLFKEILITDAQGEPVAVEKAGSISSGEEYTQSFRTSDPWPEKIRVQVVMHDDLEEKAFPFRLENLDLFDGRGR